MHSSIGAPMPHTKWYLPSGVLQTTPGEAFICIQNPNSKVVTIEITVLGDVRFGATGEAFVDELAPDSRKTYRLSEDVSSLPGSVIVTSKDHALPIVVENSHYVHQRAAGTNSIGAFEDAACQVRQ